jgi:hypothetical protein
VHSVPLYVCTADGYLLEHAVFPHGSAAHADVAAHAATLDGVVVSEGLGVDVLSTVGSVADGVRGIMSAAASVLSTPSVSLTAPPSASVTINGAGAQASSGPVAAGTASRFVNKAAGCVASPTKNPLVFF